MVTELQDEMSVPDLYVPERVQLLLLPCSSWRSIVAPLVAATRSAGAAKAVEKAFIMR
ncbi:hypothetical protein PF004_g32431 [Phytophthora fragariae]|nr:hypothetical protein PF004_g32431 [Phytophthora fragariae]